MVHVTDLGSDYFQFDEARHELRGERTGIRYQLTDRVTVQISRVDLDARKIDLRLVNEPSIRTRLKNEVRRTEIPQPPGAKKKSAKKISVAAKVGKKSGSKVGAKLGKVKAKPAKKSIKNSKKKR
jgi:ribonuclease R